MLNTTSPIPDWRGTFDDVLAKVASDKDISAMPGRFPSTWRGALGLCIEARKRGDFEEGDRLLQAARESAEHGIRQTEGESEGLATLRLGQAQAYVLLGHRRLEQADVKGAVALYRAGIAALDSASSKNRWTVVSDIGTHLLEFVEQTGRSDAAEKAVDILRDALPTVPNQAGAQNLLGLALAQQGLLNVSMNDLQESCKAFSCAISIAQNSPTSEADINFVLRVRINLAAVALKIYEISEPIKDVDGLLKKDFDVLIKAEKTLHAIIDELSVDSVDYPRAMDNLGSILIALKDHKSPEVAVQYTKNAIEAYKKAYNALSSSELIIQSKIKELSDQFYAAEMQILARDLSKSIARSLTNFGRAYMHLEGLACEYEDIGDESCSRLNYIENALILFDKAQERLAPSTMPLAWSLTQTNRGAAILRKALVFLRKTQPSAAKSYFMKAIKTYESAREQIHKDWTPIKWATATIALGKIYGVLGEFILKYKFDEDINSGINYIKQAIILYNSVEPVILDNRSLIKEWKLISETLKEWDDNYHLSGSSVDKEEIISYITNFLVSKGIKRAAWPDLFGEIAGVSASDKLRAAEPMRGDAPAEVRAPAPTEPPASVDRVAIHKAGTATAQRGDKAPDKAAAPLPQLPPGLEWPKTRYQPRTGIVEFLETYWGGLIKSGVVTRTVLRLYDSRAERALQNFLSRGGTLPSHLKIPTKTELYDRLLEEPVSPGDQPARLDWVRRKRAQARREP